MEVDVRGLGEPWMVEADVCWRTKNWSRRYSKPRARGTLHSATRGRAQTLAETALRLLLVKHVQNWSFDRLEREVALHLGYREFARIGVDKSRSCTSGGCRGRRSEGW